MNKLHKLFTLILTVLSLFLFAPVVNAEVAIITHPDVVEDGLYEKKLAKIYLGQMKSYSNGVRVIPVDLPKESSIHQKFYSTVVKKSDSAMNRYWAKRKYTGKGKPPKQIDTNREVIKWVAHTKGAIGYIDARYVKFLKKSVKVVLVLP